MNPNLELLKEKLKTVPKLPGVYIFRNVDADPIYVGKASILKSRVSSYFQNQKQHNHKTIAMLSHVKDFEWIVLDSEQDALIKENELIKLWQPHYNIMLRDDKTYPWVKVTIQDAFPRIYFTRKLQLDGAIYYGPYPKVYDAKKIINHVIETYKIRDCKDNIQENTLTPVCINLQIGTCDAPCQNLITAKEYGVLIKKATRFLDGQQKDILRMLKQKMQSAAHNMQFEKAADIRDMIHAAQTIAQGKTLRLKFDESKTIKELQKFLNLQNAPNHIECFDISNISGTHPVASQVVFKSAKPSKKDYRKYKIRDVTGIDDFAMMHEAVFRAYKRRLIEKKQMPDLIIVDGGKGQLSSGYKALQELQLDIPMVGLAKQFELIYTTHSRDPIVISKHTDSLKLLQRIRDEAHRFAITFHRQLRQSQTLNSQLLEITGVGPVLAQKLLKKFKSVDGIKKASISDISKTPGVSLLLAQNISKFLNTESD